MINSHDIEENGLSWAYADTLQSDEFNKPIVTNTDLSGGAGVHWIVAILMHDRSVRSGRVCYIYDPLGPDNDRVSSDGFPTMMEIKRGLRVSKFKIYPYASQLDTTTRCGWFSIYVARLLTEYLAENPSAKPTDLDGVIEDKFGTSADRGDERVLASAFS